MPVAKLVLASFAPHKLGIGFATSHMRLTSFRIVREEVVETSVVLKTAKALPTNVDDPSFSPTPVWICAPAAFVLSYILDVCYSYPCWARGVADYFPSIPVDFQEIGGIPTCASAHITFR